MFTLQSENDSGLIANLHPHKFVGDFFAWFLLYCLFVIKIWLKLKDLCKVIC